MSAGGEEKEPDPYVMAAVVALVRRSETADAPRSPVIAPVSEHLSDLTDVDHAIARDLDALTAVCLRPADRLGIEHVLVRANEARRVPVEGLIRLASRTEEWRSRDDSGKVIPAKLLTARFKEEYDFFENRMAVQLVDRLRRYLARRLRDLDTLERHMAGLERYEQALNSPQSHWKLHRLSVLLGQAASDGAVRTGTIRAAADRLQPLLRGLNRLRGTPLYGQANRRTSIPFRLPRTNLLTRDLRYRRTAALWEAWALDEAGSVDEHRGDRESFATAYGAFVATATAHAQEVLGLNAVQAHQTEGGSTIEIRSAATVLARVIAVPVDLTNAPGASHTKTVDTVPTVLAYPGLRVDRDRLASGPRALAHWTGPPRPDDSRTGVVPVNPLEIESTERLARALRWALWAPFILESYPQRVHVPPWWRPQPDAWIEPGPDALRLLRPPTGTERVALATEVQHADRTRPRRKGEYRQLTESEVMAAVDEAVTFLKRIAACPVCQSDYSTRFDPRAEATFHCRCGDCKAQWGLRKCAACKQRFPVLWANGATVVPTSNEDAVDATYGSDIAALPCPESADWSQFRCPWCKVCQSAPSCACSPV